MKKMSYILWTIIVLVIIVVIGYFMMISNSNSIKIMMVLIGLAVLVRIIITPIVALMVQHHDKIKASKEEEK